MDKIYDFVIIGAGSAGCVLANRLSADPDTKVCIMEAGKKDTVISYKQTLKIQEILIKNNKYSEVIFFDDEGHGFRNIENKEVVMQKSKEFLKNALNI